eukprot:m.367909 g.367909  ORF g.367909 m.367909 type:complete len:431 (-) comp16666_c1_seq12:62-1354(-)
MDSMVDMVHALSNKPHVLASELNKARCRVSPEMLKVMSPAEHSLGWLEVLHVMGNQMLAGNNVEFFVQECNVLFLNCNAAQIQASPAKFSELVSKYTSIVVDVDALSAVYPLKTAVEKLRRSPEHLTAVHAEFVKVAIKARCSHVLREILDVDICYLGDGDYHKLQIVSLLMYYFYGGVAYLSLKEYDRAMQFFSVVISAPAEQVSAIMIEAYKKYVLTSLLHYGKLVDLPGYASFALRQIKVVTQPYQNLITAYATNDAEAFVTVVAKYHDKFKDDKNLGLVVLCHEAITRRNIRRLTEMFLTMSLSAIATRVNLAGPKEAEEALVGMINAGEIHASIDQVTGTVSFHDDEEKYDTEASLLALHARVEETASQHKKIMELDAELRTSAQYIKKTSTQGSEGAGASDVYDPVGGMDGGFGGFSGMALDRS